MSKRFDDLSPVSRSLMNAFGPLAWFGVFSLPCAYFIDPWWLLVSLVAFGGAGLLLWLVSDIEKTVDRNNKP